MNAPDSRTLDRYFDTIHQDEDPFGYRSRWYEARKRDILMATLPQQRFASGWEMGCSNGELTAALAGRCERLLATDLSENAVRHARRRTAGLTHVEIRQARHPGQWPGDSYDLIVLSEVGYYLSNDALTDTVERIGDSLRPDGVLVACHWLHGFDGAYQDGRQVHARLGALLPMPVVYRYEDADFVLEAWSTAGASVAQREGLR